MKLFLDIYRIEYGLNYHILGLKEQSLEYLKYVDPKNMNFNTKVLFKLPPFILRFMLRIKQNLRNYGIDFTVYH